VIILRKISAEIILMSCKTLFHTTVHEELFIKMGHSNGSGEDDHELKV